MTFNAGRNLGQTANDVADLCGQILGVHGRLEEWISGEELGHKAGGRPHVNGRPVPLHL